MVCNLANLSKYISPGWWNLVKSDLLSLHRADVLLRLVRGGELAVLWRLKDDFFLVEDRIKFYFLILKVVLVEVFAWWLVKPKVVFSLFVELNIFSDLLQVLVLPLSLVECLSILKVLVYLKHRQSLQIINLSTNYFILLANCQSCA